MQSTSAEDRCASTPSAHTDLMCASCGTRRRIPAGFKPTSLDLVAEASRLRARPAPPRPGEHSRAANHHVLPRLRRPPRVESDPSGHVARERIGATQRHGAPPPQLPVTSGRRGIPPSHSSEGPGRLARSVDRVRWRGTHPHAAVFARAYACGWGCTLATQWPRRASSRLQAAAQAAQAPPAWLRGGLRWSGGLIETLLKGSVTGRRISTPVPQSEGHGRLKCNVLSDLRA